MKATPKMIEYAEDIAEELELEDELNCLLVDKDFDKISGFIEDYRDEFQCSKRCRRRE